MHPIAFLRPATILLMTVLLGVGSVASEPVGLASTPAVRKLALGVTMLPYADLATVDKFTAASGRAPAAWSVWSSWGDGDAEFPTALMNGLHDRGITPLVI